MPPGALGRDQQGIGGCANKGSIFTQNSGGGGGYGYSGEMVHHGDIVCCISLQFIFVCFAIN